MDSILDGLKKELQTLRELILNWDEKEVNECDASENVIKKENENKELNYRRNT